MSSATLRLPFVAYLVLCSTAFADSNISFETPGERVSVLLKDWSANFGMKVAAAKSTADEVVAVRLQNVPEHLAMDRLANLLHASWSKEGGSLYLVRTDRQDREQFAEERAADVAEIRAEQAKIATDLAAQGPFDEAAAEKLADDVKAHLQDSDSEVSQGKDFEDQIKLSARGPIGRAVSRLRLTITAEELADLPIGIRVVYATSPTALERPLPEGAAKIIEQMVAEQSLWAGAARDRKLRSPRGVYAGELLRDTAPLGDTVKRILFAIGREARDSTFQVELILGDDKQQVIARSESNLISFGGSRQVRLEQTDTATALQIPTDAFAITSKLRRMRGGPETLEPDLRTRLLDPEKHEPLALICGSTLMAAAKAKGENLMALLSDAFCRPGEEAATTKTTTAERVLNLMRTAGTVHESGGWLDLRPLRPANDRIANADRTVLGQFLRESVHGTLQTIEQRARWAVELPSRRSNLLPLLLATVLSNAAAGPSADEDLLRLYGGLTFAQRSQAASATGISLANLPQGSRDALDRMVFGFHHLLTYDRGQPAEPVPNPGAIFGIGSEPTELFAAGYPPGATLSTHETTSSVVATAPSNAPSRLSYYSARDLASLFARQKHPDQFPGADSSAAPDALYVIGQSRELNFNVRFSPRWYLRTLPLAEVQLSDGDPMIYSDLPSDFRAEVDRFAAQQEAMFGAGRRRIRGQSVPPP